MSFVSRSLHAPLKQSLESLPEVFLTVEPNTKEKKTSYQASIHRAFSQRREIEDVFRLFFSFECPLIIIFFFSFSVYRMHFVFFIEVSNSIKLISILVLQVSFFAGKNNGQGSVFFFSEQVVGTMKLITCLYWLLCLGRWSPIFVFGTITHFRFFFPFLLSRWICSMLSPIPTISLLL